VVVAISHTDGGSADVHRAAAAGATLNTHLGNGCPEMLHRHKAPLWAQLANPALHTSIICDGFHLPPDVVKVILAVKGIDKIILVTDAVHVAQLPRESTNWWQPILNCCLRPGGQGGSGRHGGIRPLHESGDFGFYELCPNFSGIRPASRDHQPGRIAAPAHRLLALGSGPTRQPGSIPEEADTLRVQSVIAQGRCVYSA